MPADVPTATVAAYAPAAAAGGSTRKTDASAAADVPAAAADAPADAAGGSIAATHDGGEAGSIGGDDPAQPDAGNLTL